MPIVVVFLLCASWCYVNPSLVQEWVDSVSEVNSPIDEYSTLSIQEDERWLVIVVDFESHKSIEGISDVDTAKELLNSVGGASGYFNQMTSGESALNITFAPEVVHTGKDIEYYAKDLNSNERDVGEEGSEGAMGLAKYAIKAAANQGIDLADFDLNGDSSVDRILILHTGGAQEDGGNFDNQIWSHFGPIDPILEIGESGKSTGANKVRHYTMSSFKSGIGTIIHEMLHQLGAVDLYAVHDDTPTDPWHGVGDWGIMSGGNWNTDADGLSLPSLPMAATMELMGVERFIEYDMQRHPPTNDTHKLIPMSEGGLAIKLKISDDEYIWFENRNLSGFDASLPGSGVLISRQDTSVGNLTQNNVNTDSENPWLMIIEADGDAGLVLGNDEGSSGDVFDVGMKIGSEGHIIRNKHGVLVDWTVEVISNSSGMTIQLISGGRSLVFEVESNPLELIIGNINFPVILSPGEGIGVNICTPVGNLSNSNHRGFSSTLNSNITFQESGPVYNDLGDDIFTQTTMGWENASHAPSIKKTPSERGKFSGIIGCETSLGGEYLDVELNWVAVGNKILTTEYNDGVVSYETTSELIIPLQYFGNDTRSYYVSYEGAFDRIGVTDAKPVLLGPTGDTSELRVTVDPQGLLTPGMIARGTIVLESDGIEHRIEIVVKTDSSDGLEGEFTNWFSNPGYVLSMIFTLSALWVFMGVEWKRKPHQISEQTRHSHLPSNFSGFANPTTSISGEENIPIGGSGQTSENPLESWD